jgi:saccharopine dehydrogenase-like NADP-dependent oxidoreductase
MSRNILLLGAGKSSGELVSYLASHAPAENWRLVIADLSEAAAREKAQGLPAVTALQLDIHDEAAVRKAVGEAALVISLLPAQLHVSIARRCVEAGVHLATASYVSPDMQGLHEAAVRQGIILLNECGLDPGLDHLSAMKALDCLREEGATILAFRSYTGGLVAPESNDNPWGYKFSWNPRNVILAGQGTASYIRDGKYRYIPYHRLFGAAETITVRHPELGVDAVAFDGYANRDSLQYRQRYGLHEVPTLLRGTLRQQNFCKAWDVFVRLGLTDDSFVLEDSERLTWAGLVDAFLPSGPEGGTLQQRLKRFMGSGATGEVMEMIEWTGIFSDRAIGRVRATPARVLQDLLEDKWKLAPHDRDMIVMQHDIRYRKAGGGTEQWLASLVVRGKDSRHTAMARTVGLPLAMACRLLLSGRIRERGCVVPLAPEWYDPVLKELSSQGITFHEVRQRQGATESGA